MATRTKKVLVVLLGASLLTLTFLGGLSTLGEKQRTSAEMFLGELRKWKIDNPTFADAKSLADRYAGKPWSAAPQGRTCTAQECYFYFSFENPRKILPRSVVSRVVFNAVIHVRKDRVVTIELAYRLDSSSGQASYDLRESSLEESSESYQRYRKISAGYSVAALKANKDGVPSVVEIRLNKDATQNDRDRAYALDFSCLAKALGCKDPTAVVPRGLTLNP